MLNKGLIQITDDPAEAAQLIFTTFGGICPPVTEDCSHGRCIECWEEWLEEQGMEGFKLICEFSATFAGDKKH